MAVVNGYKDALSLVDKENTCVKKITSQHHLALNPKFLGDVGKGIREHLNSQLNTYCERINGVPIAFGHVTCRQSRASVYDDQPFVHVNCSAETIVFQPSVGEHILGTINKKGSGFIGCLVHGVFNVAIHKEYGNRSNQWHGDKLSVGDEVLLKIKKIQISKGVLFINAHILDTSLNTTVPRSAKKESKKHNMACVNADVPRDSTKKLKHKSSEMLQNSSLAKDTNSVGSLDSGFGGGVTTPEIESSETLKKSKKAKKHKHKDTEHDISGLELDQLNTSKKTHKHSKQQEHETSLNVSSVPNQSLYDIAEFSAIHDDSIIASSSKKKKKDKKRMSKNLDDDDDDVIAVAVEPPTAISLDTSIEVRPFDLNCTMESVTMDSAKKKKKKRKKDQAEDSFDLGNSVIELGDDNATNRTVNTEFDTSETVIVGDLSEEKSKKKKKRKREESETVHMSVDVNDNHEGSSAHKKKKKKKDAHM